ncbi:tryptophan halogenase family protein [Microbulbifer aggregans]|uniref:tryptophan halogenase family protein n=1 Tax=Microbulbifer aggregans TaxID=1769779 RepID=UPI001CFD3C48|nr:tryptophan halogenase family protein [Microbulbifer aggregans]
MRISKIAIVGGGTAGWLAANHLGRVLGGEPGIDITLIESPDIPVIGVGEGTVPTIRDSLRQFGISETDFIRRCDVSFKQAIKYVNWLDKDRHGEGNSYYHLFDYPFPFGEDLTEFWLSGKGGKSFADTVSAQAALCDAGLGPKRITSPEYQGDSTYAYHFDAKKFAALLKDNAMEKFGVEYLSANVTDANIGAAGLIESLVTRELGKLEFDFYIDATGFSCFLLGQKLGVKFEKKSDCLLVDSALVVQVPTAEDEEIPPYTIATAHQAGWIWDIALPARRGVGFVYSSGHMSDVEAERKLHHYLGVEPGALAYRKIPMKVGCREVFWKANCVALGLAQGFVEPLEATSILLTDFAARFLAERFPRVVSDIPTFSHQYNKTLGYSWDRVIEFIKMHYCISDRQDSDFWVDNRAEDSIPKNLQERLNLWESRHPSHLDFFSKFEIFDVENFLYVLYGMQYSTAISDVSEEIIDRRSRVASHVEKISQQLVGQMPSHRSLIEKVVKYGLQKQ